MIKTFTIHAISRKEISPGKGSIIWLLSDEKGAPRKVASIADINKAGVVEAIHPVYSREAPLVDALLPRLKGERVTVDFAPFNQAKGYAARDAYRQMQAQEQANHFLPRVWRGLVWAGVLCLLVFGCLAIMNVLSMSSKFPIGTH